MTLGGGGLEWVQQLADLKYSITLGALYHDACAHVKPSSA